MKCEEIPKGVQYGHRTLNEFQTYKALSMIFIRCVTDSYHIVSELINLVVPGGKIEERSLANSGIFAGIPGLVHD